jgi:two-component system, chemotaxis family, CheB/CheR fusion protein
MPDRKSRLDEDDARQPLGAELASAGADPASDQDARERPSGVVGLGASAGGLDALARLLQHMPNDTGLALVVVVHLSPEHESRLAEVLQRHTSMPVRQVQDPVTQLAPNTVYVIPPGRNLNSVDSHLRLSPLEPTPARRAPIDHFFRTLAETNDGASIGVILSGSGSDGALGMRSIKEHGGLTLVQDPSEAAYDSMPQASIATGAVDMALPVERMPDVIASFAATQPRVTRKEHEAASARVDQHLLRDIVTAVRQHSDRDFAHYKRATLLRRVTRRMQLHGIADLETYRNLVHGNPAEALALGDEFLINVTEFFRDPEVFAELERSVVPRLLEAKGAGEKVRLWSVGCATGEEAYSLAMLLHEAAAELDDPPQVQVFASDVHQPSLQRAREGRYPETVQGLVSSDRLSRFFDREADTFVIKPHVRETVVFAPHNVLADAPFSQLDLVVCRNLLIYLERAVQHEMLEVFHYALRNGGYLVLGTSESIGDSESFIPVDKRHGIYRKRQRPHKRAPLPIFPLASGPRAKRSPQPLPPGERAGFGHLHGLLVDQLGPATLLLDNEATVVHLSSRAGRFLRPSGGALTGDVYRLMHPDLRLDLRAVMHEAARSGGPAFSPPIELRDGHGAQRSVTIDAIPVRDAPHEGFTLLVLHELDADSIAAPREGAAAPEARALARLEAELERERQRLRSVLETQVEGQEGLRSANEELMSVNEELRVTMEELETSREELQSVNEELLSLNQENRYKVDELTRLSTDLTTLMTSSEIGMLFLDRSLRIVRFTPRVAELFNVRHSDCGRPLSDLTHRLGAHSLPADARHVLARLESVTRELRREDGKWFLTRTLPYRSGDDRIEGVVVTFVDITDQKEVEAHLQEANDRLERLMDDLRTVNEELAAFGHSVSRELGEPLRAIAQLVERAAEREGVPGDTRESLRGVAARARTVEGVVAGLLALADAGRGLLEHRRVNLSELAEDVVRDLRARHPERPVEVEIEPDLLAVGDRRLLRMLLVDLLDNASNSATLASRARIEFRRCAGTDALCIRDNGAGTDAPLSDELFTRSGRLRAADEASDEGIRLALARRIVRRHGGSLEVTRSSGEGTNVAFTLPRPAAAEGTVGA